MPLEQCILKEIKHLRVSGGSGEIRTHEQFNPSLVFKTSAFNHSATLPCGSIIHKAGGLTNGLGVLAED